MNRRPRASGSPGRGPCPGPAAPTAGAGSEGPRTVGRPAVHERDGPRGRTETRRARRGAVPPGPWRGRAHGDGPPCRRPRRPVASPPPLLSLSRAPTGPAPPVPAPLPSPAAVADAALRGSWRGRPTRGVQGRPPPLGEGAARGASATRVWDRRLSTVGIVGPVSFKALRLWLNLISKGTGERARGGRAQMPFAVL